MGDIRKEVSEALTALHKQITSEYIAKIGGLERHLADYNAKVGNLERRIVELETQLRQSTQELGSMRQLAKRDDSAIIAKVERLHELQTERMNELVPHIIKSAADVSSRQVLAVVERDIVPNVNKAVQWLGYHTQDSAGLVDEYRMAVMGARDDTKDVGHFKLAYN